MDIKEIIQRRIEGLLLIGGFTEDELALTAIQYVSQMYSEAMYLRFVQWKDLESCKRDLFGFEENSHA